MDKNETAGVVAENAEDGDKSGKKIELDVQQTARKEELIREFTDMGFSKASVLQIVENSVDFAKDLIVEQLLSSNSEPADAALPVVDDDGDEMWEDMFVRYKMIIVMNMGLNMSMGKTASQAAHAALGLYEVIKESRPDLSSDMNTWNNQGSRKIVVEAKNTTELVKLSSRSKFHNIPFFCVHDAGLTEVVPNSFTALAFFGSDEQLTPLTGKLRLLK